MIAVGGVLRDGKRLSDSEADRARGRRHAWRHNRQQRDESRVDRADHLDLNAVDILDDRRLPIPSRGAEDIELVAASADRFVYEGLDDVELGTSEHGPQVADTPTAATDRLLIAEPTAAYATNSVSADH